MSSVISSLGAALLLAAAVPGVIHAQTFPSKPVRIIVGFPPGAGVDIAIRLIGPKMAESLGQQIVVDNRPGAGGNIGAELAARAPADGYTLFGGGAPAAISMTLYSKLSYDLLKDFEAIALVASVPQLFVVHPSLPARSVKEFVALAKKAREPLTYASTGAGSSPHLVAEMLKLQAGIPMVHIPYKGGAPAIVDLLGGQIQFVVLDPPTVMPHLKAGRLKAIATTAAKRSLGLPDTPTFAESGLPGFDTYEWYGIFGPAKLPKAVLTRLNVEINRIIKLPDVNQRFLELGAIPHGNTVEEFTAFLVAPA